MAGPWFCTSPCNGWCSLPGCVFLQCGGNDPSDTGKIRLPCVGTRHWVAHGPVLHGSHSRVHALLFLHLHRDSPAGRSSFTTLPFAQGRLFPGLNLGRGTKPCSGRVGRVHQAGAAETLCTISPREGSQKSQCSELLQGH